MSKFICFGEILWDGLPSGKLLGGAPLNVAFRLMQLGDEVAMISSIGNDNLGKEILERLKKDNFNLEEIQINNSYNTGYVNVTLDKKGSATYEILQPVAYDYIDFNETTVQKLKDADAFIFGSLACRNENSRITLQQLLPYAKKKIFDVNLRRPHYNYSLIKDLMCKADMIKMNDEELFELSEEFNSPFNSLEQNVKFLSKLTNTTEICVTKGKFGALFFQDGKFYYNSGFKVKVEDTVGAGDSFLATFLHYKTENKLSIGESLVKACAMGALVASEKGPNPLISDERLLSFIRGK